MQPSADITIPNSWPSLTDWEASGRPRRHRKQAKTVRRELDRESVSKDSTPLPKKLGRTYCDECGGATHKLDQWHRHRVVRRCERCLSFQVIKLGYSEDEPPRTNWGIKGNMSLAEYQVTLARRERERKPAPATENPSWRPWGYCRVCNTHRALQSVHDWLEHYHVHRCRYCLIWRVKSPPWWS